jgi:hypothetical protein
LFVNDGPAETAYAAYKQRLSDAWRAKPLRDMKETGARQMSKDTLKQNARGGTVQPRSPKGSRVATPTASPKLSDLGVTDAALEQSQRVCAEARNKYWSDLGNAWQKVSSL